MPKKSSVLKAQQQKDVEAPSPPALEPKKSSVLKAQQQKDGEAPSPPALERAEIVFDEQSPKALATEKSALDKCVGCLVLSSLYGFNVVSFLACLVIIAGQVAAMSQLDFRSPELVVLGTTIVALWVLSVLGVYGVYTSHRQLLRMYAFMLLMLILLQVSIVVTLYQNLDSSFMDEFAKLISSLCISPFEDGDSGESVFGVGGTNVTLDDSGSFAGNATDTAVTFLEEMGMFEALCACAELPEPRRCIRAWVDLQFYKAFAVIVCLFVFV